MKHKCSYCQRTTTAVLQDFYAIGWEAVSVNNGKAICFCPDHTANKLDEVIKYLR